MMEKGRGREESKNDNFQVGVRVRPPLHSESAGTRCVHLEHGGVTVFRGNVGSEVRAKPSSGVLIDVNDLGNLHPLSTHQIESRPQAYFYDSIFDTIAQQEEVYNTCAHPIVMSVLEGYNGSVIAYGQTGTGKTHTIEGAEGEEGRGIVPRCCEEIFSFIRSEAGSNSKFLVRVSFLEIYNERLFDLLDPSREKLRMREDGSGCTFVEGLSEQVVKQTVEVNKLLRKGSTARTTDASRMNKESSRSHAVFTIVVERSAGGSSSRVTIGKLRLVDLAGSERFDVEAKDKHLMETKNINTSLTTFGKVVLALTTPGTYSYVPYRDSKLTRILKDSLGGNSKTFLVCTVSPMSDCYQETVSTLKFAKRAKTIENKAVVNQDFTKKAMISAYEKEIVRLQRELIESREGWVSAGELDKVREEKQRAESERQEVVHQLQRHQEAASRAQSEREDYERRIMKLEEILIQGGNGSEEGRESAGRKTLLSQSQSQSQEERELENRRQQLEVDKQKLLNEQQMFQQEKDSFQRGRTAPDGQTGSDEEEDRSLRRRGNSISSIGSQRTGQASRQPFWSQGYPSLYSPPVHRSYQGWIGHPQHRSSSLYDESYRKALSTYVMALAHPRSGIPCRHFDNGLVVFSGSHAAKWFIENMESMHSVAQATEVGQKLLNLQVFINMDGALVFLSADTSYYRFAPEFAVAQHKLSLIQPDMRGVSPPGGGRSTSGYSLRSQRSRSLSPDFRHQSQDSVSVNTYSLLSDTSSVSSYSSTSTMSRVPLVERMGWSSQAPSLLHLTASQGNRSLLKKLLRKQNVDECEMGGRSPLMYAVLGDQLKCAEILIKGGAGVNLVDETGNSALCYAVQFGRDQVVRLLLKSGANLAMKNKDGKNAMHIGAEIEESLRCLEFLCKHSSCALAVNERDSRMQSPLHISVFASLPIHTRILLMSRAKLSVTDAECRTPLHYAVTANSLSCIQAILESCGKDINIPDTSGWSPLHLACHDGSVESVQLLLSSKHCDVNLQDLHHATPLHVCVFANRPDLIRKLIDAGGAVRSQDMTKRAPLHYAIERGYTECAHLLQRHNIPSKGKSLLLNLRQVS